MTDKSKVAVIMGSQSDWPTMKNACETLESLGVLWNKHIVSAHRTPDRMHHFARNTREFGIQVVIAGAGGSAHLPGMVASECKIPVLGVAVPSSSNATNDQAAIGSMIAMPAGAPLFYMGLGRAGAVNAALGAVRILALSDPVLCDRYAQWVLHQTASVPEVPEDEPAKS